MRPAQQVATLMRALVKLEDEDRVAVPGAILSMCRRCCSVTLAEGLQSHRDTCPYAALGKLGFV